MDGQRIELGHGVVVEPVADGRLRLTSATLELGLQVRRATFPGTAVAWHEGLYEVVSSAGGELRHDLLGAGCRPLPETRPRAGHGRATLAR